MPRQTILIRIRKSISAMTLAIYLYRIVAEIFVGEHIDTLCGFNILLNLVPCNLLSDLNKVVFQLFGFYLISFLFSLAYTNLVFWSQPGKAPTWQIQLQISQHPNIKIRR